MRRYALLLAILASTAASQTPAPPDLALEDRALQWEETLGDVQSGFQDLRPFRDWGVGDLS